MKLIQDTNICTLSQTTVMTSQAELNLCHGSDGLGQLFLLLRKIGNRCRDFFFTNTHQPSRVIAANTSFTGKDQHRNWIRTAPLSGHSHAVSLLLQKGTGRALAGQSILLVGGRAALYTHYQTLIESAGGHLILFRKSEPNAPDRLIHWLDRVGIVICPVDCIQHEDFFMVTGYCQRTSKPCLMLQRSDITTFAQAVNLLRSGCALASSGNNEDRAAA